MDCVRAEDAYTSRLGYEEHIPGQVPAAWPCPPWAPPSPSLGGCQAGFCVPPYRLHLLICLVTWNPMGPSMRRWKKGLPRARCVAQTEPVSPWFLFRPGTGMRSCRQQENCPARIYLSASCEKEPYSRCSHPLMPDSSLRLTCHPPARFLVNRREAGMGSQGILLVFISWQTTQLIFQA